MTVAVTTEGHVAVIEMTGDGRHNPLSVALVTAMLAAFDSAEVAQARAVVICSAAKSFCAGANIPDLLGAAWMEETPTGPGPEDLFARIEAHDRPVIAAVHGNVMGGGFELTLCVDLVVADAATHFALPETGLGVIPNTALPKLAAMVGVRRAIDIILTRRLLSAAECHTLGFVTAVTEENPRDIAIATAQSIVEGAPRGGEARTAPARRDGLGAGAPHADRPSAGGMAGGPQRLHREKAAGLRRLLVRDVTDTPGRKDQ
jgi:enoyl-CoA hydratase